MIVGAFAGVIGEGYFCKNRFNERVVELVKLLVPATRILWQQTKVKWSSLSKHQVSFSKLLPKS